MERGGPGGRLKPLALCKEKRSESSRTNPFKGRPHHSEKHPPRTSGGKFYYSDWTKKPRKNTALPAIEFVDLRHTPNSLEGCFL
ncbi:hypothetical protein TNCV_1341961 [Trichonephila clavipes]|uniref:Uncharacterized protein n=1 Tax=Trichonephila clavipes TaxID=2585209 RepID=A0A8X6V9S5_TRICX|nr:hypothetical protein TNCV_1341961 [Trichonephila clavipes]